MHADKTSHYLNQVLNWNSLTVARIWYSRHFSIRVKRASASKPCKKRTLSQSSMNNVPQNHPTTSFSSGLDQGDNWSSNWATTSPPAPGSHTWGGTSAGKLFSRGSVCSQQPTKNNYPRGYFRVILLRFPHCFMKSPQKWPLRENPPFPLQARSGSSFVPMVAQHPWLTGRLQWVS